MMKQKTINKLFYFFLTVLILPNIIQIYTEGLGLWGNMVNIIAPKISVSVHIPGGVVVVGIKAVSNIAALNFLVSHVFAIPKAKLCDDKNRLRKLNVQIDALVFQIRSVRIAHDFIELVVRMTGILFL